MLAESRFFPKSLFVFVASESLVMLSFGVIRSRLSSKSKRRLVVAAYAAQGGFAARKLYKRTRQYRQLQRINVIK